MDTSFWKKDKALNYYGYRLTIGDIKKILPEFYSANENDIDHEIILVFSDIATSTFTMIDYKNRSAFFVEYGS